MDTLYFSTLDSPVEVDHDIYLPDMQLVDTQTIDCSMNYTSGNLHFVPDSILVVVALLFIV